MAQHLNLMTQDTARDQPRQGIPRGTGSTPYLVIPWRG